MVKSDERPMNARRKKQTLFYFESKFKKIGFTKNLIQKCKQCESSANLAFPLLL